MLLGIVIDGFVAGFNHLSAPGSGLIFDCCDDYSVLASNIPDVVTWFASQDIHFTSLRLDVEDPLIKAGWSISIKRPGPVLSQYVVEKADCLHDWSGYTSPRSCGQHG